MSPLEQAARPISLGVSRYIAQAKREREARERSRVCAGIVLALYLAALAGVLVGAI